jgi:LysM repeat protein
MRTFTAITTALVLTLSGCKKKPEPISGMPPEVKLPKIELDTPGTNQEPVIHVVKKGDVLSKIAKQYGVSIDAIKAANDIDNPNLIKSGDKLLIPLKSPPSETPKLKDPKPQDGRIAKSTPQPVLFDRLSKVPVLSVKYMPPEVKQHLEAMNSQIRNYAITNKLGIVGPAYCGMGSCDAFTIAKANLWPIKSIDSTFTDPQYYTDKYGSKSRDAFKIRETLDLLASMPESGWVRIAISDFPKARGLIVRKHSEGELYHPANLHKGSLLCYDPDPNQKENGKGAAAWGHIEWLTKDEKNVPWYVHAIHSEVHGGSVWGRKQFDRMMREGKVKCYAYILTTPEVKAKWYANQQAAK